MFVYNIKDILIIIIVVLIVIYFIVRVIIEKIKKVSKKNCYKCKYYKLHSVASAGDCCWYKCVKKERIDNRCSFNNNEHYEKCKCFKGKGE